MSLPLLPARLDLQAAGAVLQGAPPLPLEDATPALLRAGRPA